MKSWSWNRLQVAAGLVMALAFAASAYYWLYLDRSQQRLRAGTVERIEQQSAQLAGAVSRQMTILARLIDFTVIRLREALVANDERVFQETVRRVLGAFPAGAVPQIGYVDRYGYLIYSTAGIAGQLYLGDREHFKVHAESQEDRLFISQPMLGHATRTWSIQFTRPIRREGRFDGVVVLSVNPEYIASSLLLPDSGIDDVLTVLYLDGTFAARSRFMDKIMGSKAPLDRPFVGVDAPPAGTARFPSMVDRIERAYSWRRLDEFPLVVVVGLAEEPFLAPVERSIREARKRAAVTTATFLLLAAGIAVLLFRVARDERTLRESEGFLNGIIENIPAMIFVKDAANLRFVKLNKAGEKLLGRGREAFIGRTDHDFFPKEEADFFTARDREVLAKLSVLDIPEESIRTEAGSRVLHTRKIGIADPDGKPRFLLGVSLDITEHKWLQDMEKMRRLILETLASNRSLAEVLADVARLIERHGRGALCSILLLDQDGQHLRHGAAPSLPEAYNQAVDGVVIGPTVGSCGAATFLGERVIVEDIATHPNWASFAYLALEAGLRACWSEPIRASRGAVLGAFALYHRAPRAPDTKDLRLLEFAAETTALVIEQKRTEAELESYRLGLEDQVAIRTRELVLARDQAQTANRAKSDFLANMSHELRTPLNAVMGFSDLLRRDPQLTPSQRESLNIIHHSGAHLLGLINDILDMVKIDGGRVQVRLAPLDLAGLIGGVAETLRARAVAKGVRLRVEQVSPLPRYVRSDEAKLRQALLNLADNAIKFTDVGEVVLRVELMAGPATPWLSVEVQDSGIGIAAGDLRRVFDPFVQVGRQDAHQGTGLGLSITRQFVELLGGRVEAVSEFGRGSCFRVELPVEPVEEAEAWQIVDEAREVVGLEPDQPDHRILIVDDQPENAALLSQLLESVGFRVRIAENGARGVELFESWRPNFIWMDWRMPVRDGLEATRRIRAAASGAAVKIVAITASVLPEQEEEILAAGADDLIRKPYPFRAIFVCLARHLGVRYLYREHAPPPDPAEGKALVAVGLAALPEALRREFADALVALDCARIDELIGRVAERDAELAKAMRQHADAFDYDPLAKALMPAKAADAAA